MGETAHKFPLPKSPEEKRDKFDDYTDEIIELEAKQTNTPIDPKQKQKEEIDIFHGFSDKIPEPTGDGEEALLKLKLDMKRREIEKSAEKMAGILKQQQRIKQSRQQKELQEKQMDEIKEIIAEIKTSPKPTPVEQTIPSDVTVNVEPKSSWFGNLKNFFNREARTTTKFETASETGEGLQTGIEEVINTWEENRDEEAGQKMMEKTEDALDPQEFKKTMKAGEYRAKAERLEYDASTQPEPGKFENASLEKVNIKLEKINDQMTELVPLITTIKIGWFGHLKINSEGYITNLPNNNRDILIDRLVAEKEQLGAKGKIDQANKIVDQIEALEKYPDLLLERDKITSNF